MKSIKIVKMNSNNGLFDDLFELLITTVITTSIALMQVFG